MLFATIGILIYGLTLTKLLVQVLRLSTFTGKPVIAIEGDSAFGFSGMEVETICRYNLPVCIVVFNNNGVYKGTDVNAGGGADVAPTVFVKGARYDRIAGWLPRPLRAALRGLLDWRRQRAELRA